MFDLPERLRQWREETEATLAFDPDELDELEDHLQLAYAAGLAEKLPPEQAWARALQRLGPASALALEFAKQKLMPALFRLLGSWLQAGLLLLLFGATSTLAFRESWRGSPFFEMALLSLIVTLIFLPTKSQKNAVLAGVGNAFCLLPLLHLLFYNSLADKIIGWGWSGMAPSFSWPQILLSFLGLFFINIWWSKKRDPSREEFPRMLTLATALVLLLSLVPFCAELVGNLSLRGLYTLPTMQAMALTGDTKTHFIQWKFETILMNETLLIVERLPFALAAIVGLGILLLQYGTRHHPGNRKPFGRKIFPNARDLPWIMLLLTSGICWVLSHWIEPHNSQNIRDLGKSISARADNPGCFEILVLFYAALFLVCAYELNRRLLQAAQIRPFYASILIIVEVGVLLGLQMMQSIDFVVYHHDSEKSAQPVWLGWVLCLTLMLIAAHQASFILKKLRNGAGELSIWKYQDKNLVPFGLLLGTVLACSGLVLFQVAIVIGWDSTVLIHSLLDWEISLTNPSSPPVYDTISDPLTFWSSAGLGYICICLTLGLLITLILSALEFIRFNSFRLYRVKKAAQAQPDQPKVGTAVPCRPL